MTTTTRIRRMRARVDRLPAGWSIILGGYLVQLGLAIGLFGLAYAGGNRLRTLTTAVSVGTVVLAGVATVPSFLLLWLGRYRRTGAVLAALVGVAMLIVNEEHLSLAVFPAALFVAAVRVWAGAGLDAAALLELDPGRFERIEPPDSGDDATIETPRESSRDRSTEEQ